MKYKKGESGNPAGRPKGAENETTKALKTVKETILCAFNELQDDPKHNIIAWAKDNPCAFYAIASKLIPTEIKGHTIKVGIDLQRQIEEDETYV